MTVDPDPHKDFRSLLQEKLIASMGRLKGVRRIVMLSGGFDSMLMVQLARRYGARVSALTVQFEDFNIKTVRRAMLLAKRMDVPHQVVKVNIKEFLASFKSTATITQEPLLDLDLALVDAALKKYPFEKKNEVFISGMGSDEWFGDLAFKGGSIQAKFDKTMLHKDAHDRVVSSYGHKFVFPFLSGSMLAFSKKIPLTLKKDKKLLRMLADDVHLLPPQGTDRELQVPPLARLFLVKAYGRHAWPHPIHIDARASINEQILRQIVRGLWLEKSKGRTNDPRCLFSAS